MKRMDEEFAEFVRKMLNYDPITGSFVWRDVGACGRASAGKSPGRITSAGYHDIGLRGRRYFAHRLAWLHVHGVWPKGVIDHIDGDKLNNKISNLRDVTHAQNMHNTKIRVDNNIGVQGVTLTRTGKYRASISIGTFNTSEEASSEYLRVKALLHSGYLP